MKTYLKQKKKKKEPLVSINYILIFYVQEFSSKF